MMPLPSVMAGVEMAWVLLINAGQPSEGIYTHTHPGGAPSLLAFESVDDADAFAQQFMASGYDPATPSCWGADELTRFSHKSGLEVQVMTRGNLPPLPTTFDRPGEHGMGERQPYHRDKKPDPYTAYRLRLEALFPRKPENCRDDDCILDDADVPAAAQDQEAMRLRQEAMLAIDGMLAAHGDEIADIDLAALMKSAWEKVEEDTRHNPAEDDER